jgi:ADP-ribosylglycohydrolase
MIPDNYVEKTYAGWLGKVIGIRMGAPIENWSREKIQTMIGDRIQDYLVDYQDFAADDDSNGPVYFIRALKNYKEAASREFGYTFLNYVPKEHGFFWWGEELSTEHTAYKNLLAGIEAPESGSADRNGKELAEQIGGQIFIDGFGFAAPGNPVLAAALAESCARVTHDLNGIAGARYVAACISLAYIKTSIEDVMKEALELIGECDYSKVVLRMLKCYEEGLNWEEAFGVLRKEFWTDKYPGVCHIIPNAGIMALSMVYGAGDYLRTQELVNLCGFDTDCNAGNVGAILGVLSGIAVTDGIKGISKEIPSGIPSKSSSSIPLEGSSGLPNGIPSRLITPIKDVMLASGITGSLNISTISENALLFAGIGYELAGEEMPEPYKGYIDELEKGGIRRSHFTFPHALHGFRVKGGYKNAETAIGNAEEAAYQGRSGLKITINNLHSGNSVFVYQKTYYTPEDLHDARYQPSFSPIAYPGDEISCYLKNVTGQKLKAYLYYYDLYRKEKVRFAQRDLYGDNHEEWLFIQGKIPNKTNGLVKEIGIELVSDETEHSYFGEQVCVFMDEFIVKAAPHYGMDFSQIPLEDYSLHLTEQVELSGFTHYNGDFHGLYHTKEGLILSEGEKIFTGDYYWRNYQYQVKFVFLNGGQADFIFRSQGSIRSYYLRITEDRLAVICQLETKEYPLAETEHSLEYGKEYTAVIKVKNNSFSIVVGDLQLQAVDMDNLYPYGSIGIQVDSESTILLTHYNIKAV